MKHRPELGDDGKGETRDKKGEALSRDSAAAAIPIGSLRGKQSEDGWPAPA